jgi:hypothetical protein
MKSNRLLKLLVFTGLAIAAPLAAQDVSSIRAALASQNFGKAIALTGERFASVKSEGEARNLIRAIIAVAPVDKIPPLVVAAIRGNPGLSKEIINAAIEGASKEEAAAILTAISYVLGQNQAQVAYQDPDPAPFIGTVPIYDVLTMPWFNPANSIGVTVTVSNPVPGTP